MPYSDVTSMNTSKGFTEILNYVNNVTDNWISNMFLIAVYLLVLIGYYKSTDDFGGAIAVAGFTTFVIALLFWIGGFVNAWAFSIAIALCVVGIVVILINNQ
jgi:Zn-dependent protease with chaperone function